jgi:hypothetical protein
MRRAVLLLVVFATSLAALAQQRFDFKVREDMFAGMDGDNEAFDRAMKLIDDTLAKQPDHAEALVWRGDGRVFMAGQAFQRGDIAAGRKLYTEGLADMERAGHALRQERRRAPLRSAREDLVDLPWVSLTCGCISSSRWPWLR